MEAVGRSRMPEREREREGDLEEERKREQLRERLERAQRRRGASGGWGCGHEPGEGGAVLMGLDARAGWAWEWGDESEQRGAGAPPRWHDARDGAREAVGGLHLWSTLCTRFPPARGAAPGVVGGRSRCGAGRGAAGLRSVVLSEGTARREAQQCERAGRGRGVCG